MAYTGSKAQAGRGSQLFVGGVSGAGAPVTTLVGEVKSAGVSGAQWATEDVSNFESGADIEFGTTMRDNGTMDLMGNRVSSDAGQIAIEAAFGTGSKYDWKLQLPLAPGQSTTGDIYTFSALVVSREFPIETTKIIPFTVKLKISGPVTLTVGS
jgi:hypothetical protein